MKQKIVIQDFSLFCDVITAASKIIPSAKIIVGPAGLEIYGARSNIARCELVSDAISSEQPVSFSIEKLAVFLRILQTVQEVHDGDYSELNFTVDHPFVRFESKKIKTKYSLCDEDIISQCISKKIDASKMVPVFEFITTSDFIKRLNSKAFMFSDPKSVRVYLDTKDDMEHNAVFATLGNSDTALSNELTLKFGLVTSGSLEQKESNGAVSGDYHIILDFERINLFNAVPSDNIKMQRMSLNCLVGKTSIRGKNSSFFDLSLYSTLLVK